LIALITYTIHTGESKVPSLDKIDEIQVTLRSGKNYKMISKLYSIMPDSNFFILLNNSKGTDVHVRVVLITSIRHAHLDPIRVVLALQMTVADMATVALHRIMAVSDRMDK
jgi:hypothetical protein